MSYYVGITIVIFSALLEASVLPLFRVFGMQPNLTLVILVAWLIIRGADEAYVLAPIAGLFIGLVDGSLLGVALIALAPMAILQDLRGAQLNESGLIMAIIFTVVMSLLYNYVHLAVFTLQGESGDWVEATLRIILPVTFINVAVLLPLYAVFSIVNPQPRRSLYA